MTLFSPRRDLTRLDALRRLLELAALEEQKKKALTRVVSFPVLKSSLGSTAPTVRANVNVR